MYYVRPTPPENVNFMLYAFPRGSLSTPADNVSDPLQYAIIYYIFYFRLSDYMYTKHIII